MINIGKLHFFYDTVEEHDALLKHIRRHFSDKYINDDALNDGLCDEKYIEVNCCMTTKQINAIINVAVTEVIFKGLK